jgi:hypothetical protein
VRITGEFMPLRCPKGTSKKYVYKKGTKIRLGGCTKKGKFIKNGVKEVKIMGSKK